MTDAGKSRKSVLVVEDDRSLRHGLCKLLVSAGYDAVGAGDGVEALEMLDQRCIDLMLLDVGLPGMSGLEVLERLRERSDPPRVIVITADDAPDTLLRAVRDQAFEYLNKPFPPNEIVDVVERALSAPEASLPIDVVSARPEWVELLVPCSLDVVDRLESFMTKLEADLPRPVRESVGQAFRELLLNAIEWGGKLDPARKVRISCLRTRRMLIYRIADPGQGFRLEALQHAAVGNPTSATFEHTDVREAKGLRAGGFGLLLVRAMVDELIYNEARNEVVFVKYLDPPPAPRA